MNVAECVIHPFQGISIAGYGEVRFGASVEDVEGLLGEPRKQFERHGTLQRYYQDSDGRSDRGLSLRFDFDQARRCKSLEFLWPRMSPPTLSGYQLAGPTIREAAGLLIGLGDIPWDTASAITNLDAACRPGSPSDTIYFDRLGVSLWTEMGTETDETGDLGEYVLDAVFVWRRGYWNEPDMRDLRTALPATDSYGY